MIPLTLDEIEAVIQRFRDCQTVVPCLLLEVDDLVPFRDATLVFDRLVRAAGNEKEGSAEIALSRYRIWAETLRGVLLNVVEGGSSPADSRKALDLAHRRPVGDLKSSSALPLVGRSRSLFKR